MIDKVFSKKKEVIETFEFNEEVTQVFDDMITRSVPFYNEIHRIIVDIYKKINSIKLYRTQKVPPFLLELIIARV